uniref:hypothetical protein n=1 Tax=Acetatifactor sp. TaxID=1872090 RepID=UPI0040568D58
MDKQFMKEFGENMYEDLVCEAVKDIKEFPRIKDDYLKLDNAFYQKIKLISPELIEQYEQLTSLFSEMENIIRMALYIKGAEDRERMLR